MNVFLGTNFEQPLAEQTRVVKNIDFDWGDRSPILADASESHEAETIAQAVETARRADVVVLCLGETSRRGPQQVCGEHFDRADLGLTGRQQALADAIIATGKPVVLVLVNGRSLAIPKLVKDSGAILEAWYPGEQGGHGIADVLFGKANPSGKLPVSIPHSSEQLPVYYNRRPRMGWYIDAPSEPLFPFGFGLSYTTFEYRNLRIDGLTVAIDVTNTGPRAGDEIVQLYLEPVVPSFRQPALFPTAVKRLADFKRLSLRAGESQRVRFELTRDSFALLDRNLERRIEPGEYEIHVGSSSVDVLSGSLKLIE
jgi:beta-glucosidase